MGTAVVDTVLSSPGTEKDFFTSIYNYIMGLWSGITCTMTCNGTEIEPSTPDNLRFVDNAVTNIDFLLKEGVLLRFQEKTTVSMGVDSGKNRAYNIFFKVNEKTLWHVGEENASTNKGGGLYFISSVAAHTTSTTRKYMASKYISDNVFIVWFGDYSVTSWKNSNFYIMGIKDTSDNWHYSAGTNIDNATFYDSTGINGATKSPMFSYEARTGYLDFISHSSFVTGSTKAFTSTDIYDCTTVNFGDTLSLKDGANFLAIGAHSIVPINN